MNIKKTVSFLIAALFLCAQLSFSANDRQARVKSLRAMSMGGAFSALSNDAGAFSYNPAGISGEGYLIQLLSLDAISSEAALYFPNICFISGPIRFSNNYFNIGVGIFPNITTLAKFILLFPLAGIVSITSENDAPTLLALPISYRIVSLNDINLPGELSLGANFKYIFRSQPKIGNTPEYNGEGFGVDLGAIYHINPRWNASIQLLDAFNTEINYSAKTHEPYTSSIQPELTIGAAYMPEKIYFWPGKFIKTNRRLTLTADISDITNNHTIYFNKKLHFGAELKFSIFALRIGVNSGHLTYGGGIATKNINLEYAVYGGEEILYPVDNSLYSHRMFFSLKIGNKKRNFIKTIEEEKTELDKQSKNKKLQDVYE